MLDAKRRRTEDGRQKMEVGIVDFLMAIKIRINRENLVDGEASDLV